MFQRHIHPTLNMTTDGHRRSDPIVIGSKFFLHAKHDVGHNLAGDGLDALVVWLKAHIISPSIGLCCI